MNREDTAGALAIVRTLWPHSNLGDDPGVVLTTWQSMLAEFTPAEVGEALRAMADSGREHAPVVGAVAREVRMRRQGQPPSIEDAQRMLARLMASCVPYDARGPEDTAAAIEALAARGVHEAVLRFVEERGIYAVRQLPDGAEQGLDPNQLADRRDAFRHYRDVTLPGWREDPSPGVALDRARGATVELERPRGLRRLETGGPS